MQKTSNSSPAPSPNPPSLSSSTNPSPPVFATLGSTPVYVYRNKPNPPKFRYLTPQEMLERIAAHDDFQQKIRRKDCPQLSRYYRISGEPYYLKDIRYDAYKKIMDKCREAWPEEDWPYMSLEDVLAFYSPDGSNTGVRSLFEGGSKSLLGRNLYEMLSGRHSGTTWSNYAGLVERMEELVDEYENLEQFLNKPNSSIEGPTDNVGSD